MIDHVLACLTGDAENLIEPASGIPALELKSVPCFTYRLLQ
jgi:hypothetical protein